MNRTFKLSRILVLTLAFLLLISCSIDKGSVETGADTTVSYTGFGAVETVGGSLHRLSVGADDYIIDVGAFYGNEGDNASFPLDLDVKNIDAVLVTHAHADHIGKLPLLLEMGYDGPIYMTSVTKDIAIISILSNIKYNDIGVEKFYYTKNNKSDIKPVYMDRFDYKQNKVKDKNKVYIQSKRSELNEKGFYLSVDTVNMLEAEMRYKLENQIVPVNYEEAIKLSDDITAEFFYTSHLPGSSMIYFTVGNKNILFSGDIGSNNNPFLPENTEFKYPVDYLFLEGTYGSTIKEQDTKEERQKFIEYIGNAVKNNERVIIPAFAIDRSQQFLYEIRNGIMQGAIPENTRVKVFSPTTEKITDLYRTYSNNKNLYSSYFSENMFADIFNIKNLEINPTKPNGKMYDLDIEYGEIAVMTSGMIASGFSKDILKKYISDDDTNFISVSYQDPGEIGGMVFNGDKIIKIDDIEYEMKAKIFKSSAFSGHANISQIYDVFGELSPEQIMIVHLNSYDKESLIDYYAKHFKSSNIIVPRLKEQYLLFKY